jgi:LysM repeat protein
LPAAGIPFAQAAEHRVARGETLWDIAAEYGVDVDAIVEANGLEDPNFIYQGQVLTIPEEEYSYESNDDSYRVQPGDTLSDIALKYRISIEMLKLANSITNPDLIFSGQFLTIPIPKFSVASFIKPDSPQIESIIDSLSASEGVDPDLVKAIALVESGWRQDVVSSAGAVGLMQIMPSTAEWLEQDIFGHPLNEDESAYDNIKAGVRLLSMLLKATGNVDRAIASYYQGYGTTSSGVFYDDTLDYVEIVKAVKDTFWP